MGREGFAVQDVTPVHKGYRFGGTGIAPSGKMHTCYNALLLVFFDFFKSLQQR
jgi:hypothetical protein